MWQSRVRPVRVSERAIPKCLAGRSPARAAAAPSAPPAPPATTQPRSTTVLPTSALIITITAVMYMSLRATPTVTLLRSISKCYELPLHAAMCR